MIVQLARLPDPATYAVFSAERLINKCLVVECVLQLLILNAELNLMLNYL